MEPKAVFDPIPRSDSCRAVFDHWNDLRRDQLLPRRGEIDPAALVRHLPNVGIFEVRAHDLTICQLAGTAFHRSLGFELTGKNVIHIYGPELHRAAGYRFFMMATHPCGAMFDLFLKFSTGADNSHEVMLLPLEPDSPAAPPALLVGIAPVAFVEWQSAAVLPQSRQSPNFRFIDIGAGTPASSWPPDDF